MVVGEKVNLKKCAADPPPGGSATSRTRKIRGPCNYGVKYPTFTTFSVKNLKNAVDFHPKERLPCKTTWSQDVKSTHIRNKHLLDLPFGRPKCCSDAYNMCVDRRKLRKLQRYGLTRPVRTIVSDLEPETAERCTPEQETEVPNPTYFPECYVVPESSDESEEEKESYEVVLTDSISECSECSTLGGCTRRRMHKLMKKHWRDLVHGTHDGKTCEELIAEEIRKHKLGRDFELKLNKFN